MTKFTLRDKLVQKSLRKISDLHNEKPDLLLVTVGGLAVQSYTTNPELYRPTNDADLMTSRIISSQEFRESIGKEISDYLLNVGYESTLGKTRDGYEVKVDDKDQDFFIHLSKFSKAYLQRNNHWKHREFNNAKEVYVAELGGYPILVHRIEDILANKARRLGKLNRSGFVVESNLEEWERFLDEDFGGLGNVDLAQKLRTAEKVRSKLIGIGPENFSQNTDTLNKYKVIKDLYDLAILSRTILEGKEPLDIFYLRNALSTIPTKY